MNSHLYHALHDADKQFYNKLLGKGLDLSDVQVLTIFPYIEKYTDITTAKIISVLRYIISNKIKSSSLYFKRNNDLTYVYPSEDYCEFECNLYFSDSTPIKSLLKNFEDIVSLYFSDELNLVVTSPFKICITKIEDKYE